MPSPTHHLAIIGAGPAGLMAAITAAEAGAKVTLFEKMAKPGIKLSITGNGRGNLANQCDIDRFLEAFGKNGPFLRQAAHHFHTPDLLDFLEKLGIETVEEEDGKLFTKEGNANRVAQALAAHATALGVSILYNMPVQTIHFKDKQVCGVILQNGKCIQADKVIISTGGASYPTTGSDGSGFELAKQAGHTITPILPALVPLVTENQELPKTLQGLSLPAIKATLLCNNEKVAVREGDLLFTHFGLSGPLPLLLSRTVAQSLAKSQKVVLELDFISEQNDQETEDMLLFFLDTKGRLPIKTLLREWLPDRLVEAVLRQTALFSEKWGHQISAKERKALLSAIKHFPLSIGNTRPLAEAQVTAGGISLDEINPRTLESRLIEGLFFAGEVVDVDGESGGFNLMAAFSMGRLAGKIG
ncbi:MAG: hypothetical protein A2293_04335 [Elusimicrobia bacterium RIFOXYB2_FULL_49_7]|nr:MAG: hypothetical protein A2293_04335 [Elusimicrobia bacterium RIFOXYB2_FULL_49_7]